MNAILALFLAVAATQAMPAPQGFAGTLLPVSSHVEDGPGCLQLAAEGLGIDIHLSEQSWCGMLLTDRSLGTFASRGFYEPLDSARIAGEYQLRLKRKLGILAAGLDPSTSRDGLRMHIDVHPIRGGLGAKLAFSLY